MKVNNLNELKMFIVQKQDKWYLYFDELKPQNLCFVGFSLMAAQAKARKLLKFHNGNINNIQIITKK